MGASASRIALQGGLVLVTSNHPFEHTGGERMFVAPELERLARELGPVCVVPQHADGAAMPVPAGVEVDTSLSEALWRGRWWAYPLAPLWPGFAAEIARALRHGGMPGCARVWRWAAVALVTWRWAQRRLPPGAPLLVATYWRGGSTLALARLAAQRPRTAALTRVHGHELYEARWQPPFQPWVSVYGALACVLPISRHGADHLRAGGVAADRVWLARLGTEPAPPARASADGVLRIVSCSWMLPVKRVPLLARALVELSRRHPGRTIHWTHFGAGPERAQVQAALRDAPPDLQAHLPGQVSHGEVLAHYAAAPVDLFVLLSASEGLPVSIQEAIAAGIPVLATDVGGVAEIVGPDNGQLLPADPAPADVVAALERLCFTLGAAERDAMRQGSRSRWAVDFDAERNHAHTARQLRALMDSL